MLKRRLWKFLILLFVISNFYFCGKRGTYKNVKELVDRSSILHIGEYRFVLDFYVDYKGNIYIPDYDHYKIDKYDSKGKFLFSFGKKGEGPGEFPYIYPFAVDSEENVYMVLRGKVAIFNKKGEFVKEEIMPERYKTLLPVMVKISPLNDLVVVFRKYNEKIRTYKIVIFRNKNMNLSQEIYTLKMRNIIVRHRFIAPYISLHPSFDFDEKGNLVIADPFDYKILLFSRMGEKIKEFSKECHHEKIRGKDLEFSPLPQNDPSLKEMLRRAREEISSLKGNERYYPCIFKVNFDQGKFYIWTTKFVGGEFIVDIYDKNFNFIEHRKFYNSLAQNDKFSFIRNGYLYMADILSEDPGVKWGKLLFPNLTPSRIIKARILQ